jgi:hypothetical protein
VSAESFSRLAEREPESSRHPVDCLSSALARAGRLERPLETCLALSLFAYAVLLFLCVCMSVGEVDNSAWNLLGILAFLVPAVSLFAAGCSVWPVPTSAVDGPGPPMAEAGVAFAGREHIRSAEEHGSPTELATDGGVGDDEPEDAPDTLRLVRS